MSNKPPIHIVGMYGIGDCLHQRALVVELMRHYHVYLETCHVWVHHDLLGPNLTLILRPTTLHMHKRNIVTEQRLHPGVYRDPREIPKGTRQFRIWYLKADIDRHGTMMAAQFAAAHVPLPDLPDFSLPIKPEWRDRARNVIQMLKGNDQRPLMIHRPVVLRKEWDGKLRNPLPEVYDELYRHARVGYHVLSIASLVPNVEWVVGPEQQVDSKLHAGELEMWEMAAVFAQADVVFANAGMAPVLAQAVGTPCITVYGGRESFRTSQAAGAHLAPSLGIDPINPCDCHSHSHQCDKRVDVPVAKVKIDDFLATLASRQTQTQEAAE